MHVKELQTAIEQLSEDEFAELRRWFAEKDWERWDQQLEEDVAKGKLNILLEEVKQSQKLEDSADLSAQLYSDSNKTEEPPYAHPL